MATQTDTNEKLPLDNEQLAHNLEETAELLEGQDANPYRVRAYRNAADRLRKLDRPAHTILRQEGRKGLMALPDIGEGLARRIEQLTLTGHTDLLDQLRGASGAEAVLTSVSGVGPELARRIYEHLGITSLPELERAAHDGRLAEVPGMGPRRIRAIRDTLSSRLRHRAKVSTPVYADQPPVAELLDVDREYREKAGEGRVKKIAPKRFNPSGEAWLPVLHTRRGQRHYTALFSNTALAHQLGTTNDWVVIYRDDDEDGQWTVITSRTGALKGKRVVRGRERECAEHYTPQPEPAAAVAE